MPKDKSSSTSRAFVLSSLAAQRKSRPTSSSSILKPSSSSSTGKSTTPSTIKGKKIRADALPWKTVTTSSTTTTDGTGPNLSFDANEGGMLFLEEVEGVDVMWEEGDGGRRKAVLIEAEAGAGGKAGMGKKRKRGVHEGEEVDAEGVANGGNEDLPTETVEPAVDGFTTLNHAEDISPESEPAPSSTQTAPSSSATKIKAKTKAKSPREKAKEKRERFAAKLLKEQAAGGTRSGDDVGHGVDGGSEVVNNVDIDGDGDGEVQGEGEEKKPVLGESRAERLSRINFDSSKLPGWAFLTNPVTASTSSETQVKVKVESDLESEPSASAAVEEDGDSDIEMEDGADEVKAENANENENASPSILTNPLHPLIQSALFNLKFHQPTDIQRRGIPVALSSREEGEDGVMQGGRDVIGVAETGSGKTLAYSIPIMQHILQTIQSEAQAAAVQSSSSNGEHKKRELSALILCPTRELALQVGKVITEFIAAGEKSLYADVSGDGENNGDEDEEEDEGNDEEAERAAQEAEAAARFAGGKYRKGKGKGKSSNNGKSQEKAKLQQQQKQKQKLRAQSGPRPPPIISAATVVGGLSAVKQKRLVKRGCDILVATPGRLWDLCEEDDNFASQIKGLRFLVIDEADRMIETGHFAELENIVDLTARAQNAPVTTNAAEDDPTFARVERKVDKTRVREDMQTFVFSATLSKDLQANLKRGWQRKGKGKKATNTLDDLFDKLDFRDEKPEVIDISPEGRLVATLRESLIESVTSDKDLYLYYFLLRYPGRSLVFTSSIDGIRRLVPLFEMLKVPVYPLHSQLQQKQRLKNLDRFASSPTGVLIATDVAARGLDIPSVDHVIHFQLPRSADAYIHRSGRTARAKQDGFSLQMVSPEERSMQRNLMKSLGRTPELPELPIEPGFLPKLRERIRVAKDIEKAQHQVKKVNHDKNWLKEVADAMDLDIDPDLLSDDDEEAQANKHRGINVKHTSSGKVASLKAELNHLLKQQLMARGVSARYPTSGSRVVVDDLLGSKGQPVMLGASSAKAFEDIDTRPTKKRKFIKRKAGNK